MPAHPATPEQRFSAIIRMFTCLWSPIGCNIMDPEYRASWRTATLLLLIVIFNAGCVYTMCISDLQVAINSAAYLGIGLQGPLKLFGAVRYSRIFRGLLQMVFSTYGEIARSGPVALQQQTERFSRIYTRVFLVPCVILMIVVTAVVSGPLLFWLLLGRAWVPMLENSIPFVSNREMPGYAVTFAFHAICVGIVISGNATTDGYFMIMVMHTYLLYARVASCVAQVNARLRQGVGQPEGLRLLKATLQMHEEYYEFTKQLTWVYYPIATCDLYTNALSMCGIIYCIQMLDDSVQAIFLIMLMFAKLLILCVQGTVLDICNDCVLGAVLNVCWYQLPTPRLQRMYVLLVLAAQHPKQIMVDVKPLNMSVFVGVMKTVYTIVMILMD